jgi:predicted nucleic-acid-binding protein
MVALRDKVKQSTEDETQGHTKKINIMKEIQQHSETFISSEQIINKVKVIFLYYINNGHLNFLGPTCAYSK